ncbi:MAG: PA14 domain-containing protein, partial [Verrucomicrobia bacterium]|nr:PA14 domain-containing protein [Verrucomicrobiota bacterium]
GTFVVTATDANGCFGTRTYSITTGCAIITISPSTLPDLTVGSAYTQTLSATPQSGLIGQYYSGSNFNTLLLTRADASIDFNWGSGSPDALVPVNNFSVRWTGTLLPASTGTYTFQTTTDDGIRLWVNNNLVIDRWNDQAATSYTAGVSLTAGVAVTVRMEYYENATTAVARLQWSGPGISLQPVTGWQTYRYTVASGSLPAGLALNDVTGAISGTPTLPGTFTFTVRVSDGSSCFGTHSYTVNSICPALAITTSSLPDAFTGNSYSQILNATGGNPPLTWSLASGTLPAGLSLSSAGTITGTPTAATVANITVRVTDLGGCFVNRALTLQARNMGIGNQIWIDTNNDGLRGNTEAGAPNVRVELWSAGLNGIRDNGAGDDVKITEMDTDSNGLYSFSNLLAGVYYVRLPTPPNYYPSISTTAVTTDNGVNNDNNGVQSGGSDTPVVSPLITLTVGGEPSLGVDGDDTDRDSTIDFAFANLDLCYTNTLVDNASFEFQQLANATGTASALLNYNGSGTSLGAGINGFQWLGGTNGTSGVGEPIQRVQVLAGNAGSRVSWVESVKARHGKRYMLFQGTNSCVSLRAAGGGEWSSVLQAGREYQISIWAANASSAASSIVLDLGANTQIYQVISGSTPGLYQYYTVSQGEMTGTAPGEQQCCGFSGSGGSFSSFGSADYNNWSEATSNTTQPMWRQFTWRFRIANSVTASQIDTATMIFSGGSNAGPIAMDHITLCQVSASSTLTLGNQIWNDTNNNGLRDGSELGIGGATVQLYTSVNNTAGDADDVLVSSTTSSSGGAYNFTGLNAGKYVVRVTPTSGQPATSGTVVTLDNGANNDNNGSQPGGPGTPLFSPVIDLATGSESITDGDTNPDTELSIDFGLWSGISIGNLVWSVVNSDGVFQCGCEPGISGVTVELLDSSNNVLRTTTTNSTGIYNFTTYQPGQYRIRIPTPPAALPLITAVNDPADNGEDNDSNAIQAGGVGTAVTSPLITLTAGFEPGITGTTNNENTIDFGFRVCPTISISPTSLATATQYSPFSVNMSATGGTGPYTWTITSGSLPTGLSLTTAGSLSGTPNASALPGYYTFTVRSLDGATGCSASRTYTLTMVCPVITVAPTSLSSGVQFASYVQALTASGGTSPYNWSVSPTLPSGAVSWWIAENGP